MITAKDPSVKISAYVAGAILAFLFMTGRHLPFYEAINWVGATDVYSYLKISGAAPGFPTEFLPFHFAQRFVPHYAVGCLAHLLNCSVENAYIVASAALLGAIFFLSAKLLLAKARNSGVALLVFSLMTLSPYAFRLNALVPGMLADLVFVLGLVVCLTGLSGRNIYAVLLGALLAASGKQMILLVLPGLVLYSYAVFKASYGKSGALAFCGLLVAEVLGFNGLLAFLSSGFAGRNTINEKIVFAIFPWLFSTRFSVLMLLEHILRVFLPSFPFLILMCSSGPYGDQKELFTLENAALTLIILGPVAYAFLPGPLLQMQNQSRYTASAALAMALLTLNVISSKGYSLRKWNLLLLCPVLVLYSYHHKYCALLASPGTFLAIHLLSLAAFFLWAKYGLRDLSGGMGGRGEVSPHNVYG